MKYILQEMGLKKHFCPKGFTIQNFEIIDIPPIDSSEAIDKDDDNDFQIAMESLIRFVAHPISFSEHLIINFFVKHFFI